MWKNTVEPGRLQMTVWRMRISCWMTKATDTHPEYVAFIAVRTTVVMRTVYTYIAYLVSLHIHPFTKYHKLWPFTTGSCDG